jgi:hypothetical protein
MQSPRSRSLTLAIRVVSKGVKSTRGTQNIVRDIVRESGRKFGPYLLLEAVMPGGTLLAFAIWLYRHRHGKVLPW